MLRSEKTARTPAKVEIIHLREGHWPFTKADYDRLERVQISSGDAQKALLESILGDSKPGRTHRNHPATIHRGLLRVEYSQNEWYYVYYSISYDAKESFVGLRALTGNTYDPNYCSSYESLHLQHLLAQHDPWLPKLELRKARHGIRWSLPFFSSAPAN
jgi:hypothetical protein